MSRPSGDITEFLQAWASDDPKGRERVIALLYRDLRRRAAAQLNRERRGETLQPTALVNEAYIRLAEQRNVAWKNRAQFLAVASQMMRRILVDRARGRLAVKRSGQWAQVTLDKAGNVPFLPPQVDILDLNDALDRLGDIDARKSRIAEMIFFGGMTLEEIGDLMQMSPRTVERDWQAARALLFKMLSAQRPAKN